MLYKSKYALSKLICPIVFIELYLRSIPIFTNPAIWFCYAVGLRVGLLVGNLVGAIVGAA
jgi:hypothetical protein